MFSLLFKKIWLSFFLNKAIQNTKYIEWKYYWYDLFLKLFGKFGLDHWIVQEKLYRVSCGFTLFTWFWMICVILICALSAILCRVILIWIRECGTFEGIRIRKKYYFILWKIDKVVGLVNIIFQIHFLNKWTLVGGMNRTQNIFYIYVNNISIFGYNWVVRQLHLSHNSCSYM